MDDGMPIWTGASPLEQAAGAMRELYLALRQAGFTEREALQLVAFQAAGGEDPRPPG